MGYDKEVYSDTAMLIERIHDANCALGFLHRQCETERKKSEAFADGAEKSKASGRTAILTTAYKLALIERDALLARYNELIGHDPVRAPYVSAS